MNNLFDAGNPILELELQDRSTSDDPLVAMMERKGYSIKKQEELKARIAGKLTPSLFSGLCEPMDTWEKIYQKDVDDCIKKLKGVC